MMLPKVNRLKSDEDFKNIFKNGKGLENQFLRVKFFKNNINHSRFGFVISVKVLKKAVARNILKRRLRNIVGSFIENLKPGLDIVIWPKKNSVSINYKDLRNSLEELINKIVKNKK